MTPDNPGAEVTPEVRAAVDARFWAKVQITDGCWLWTASTTDGYGNFSNEGRRSVRAHRWAYERLVGPIPEGLQLDHLCRVRNCVNPAHLEPVTNAENARRGLLGYASPTRERPTHCPKGHEYTPENTRVRQTRSGGEGRVCRACEKARRPARVAKEREKRQKERVA